MEHPIVSAQMTKERAAAYACAQMPRFSEALLGDRPRQSSFTVSPRGTMAIGTVFCHYSTASGQYS